MNNTMMAWLSGTIIVVISARGQGTFQNLDFEAAHNLPAFPGGTVATTNALPGWQAFSGTNQLFAIHYNSAAVAYEVALYGSNSSVISGSFDAFLYNGGSIRQSGLVPTNTLSLFFKKSSTSLTPLSVSLGGQNLAYTAISSGPNYTMFGADISAFAGQSATLTFLAPLGSHHFFDDIEFSPQMIPEPSFLALLSCGGLLLAGNRYIRKRGA